MDDPNRTFEELPDFGEVPPEFEQKSGTPTWVWIVGGIAILFVCCCAAVFGSLALLGDEIDSVFQEVSGTLEAGGGDFGDIEATIEASIPQDSSETTDSSESTSSSSSEEFNSADFTYFTTFESAGSWAEGDLTDDAGTIEAQGYVTNGIYEFEAVVGNSLFWTTAGEFFGDGVYEVEVTAVDGPLDNGFGFVFFFDESSDSFYLFEISSDGFVWIGRCDNACEETEILVEDGWFQSNNVLQGLNVSNRLTVEVENGNMRFLLNGIEVGQATDTALSGGDIGFLVESFDTGGVRVHFDNVSYQESP